AAVHEEPGRSAGIRRAPQAPRRPVADRADCERRLLRHPLRHRERVRGARPGRRRQAAVMKIATPDLVTNSYFPALAAEELGLFRAQGVDAHVELMPSLSAVTALRDGAVDFVSGNSHSLLLGFPAFQGAKLLVTLSQGTPWLLVMRTDLA